MHRLSRFSKGEKKEERRGDEMRRREVKERLTEVGVVSPPLIDDC